MEYASAGIIQELSHKAVSGFAVAAWREIKINGTASAVDCAVQISPPAVHFDICFIQMPRAKSGRLTPVPTETFLHFRGIALNPAVKRGVVDAGHRVQPASPVTHGN